MYLNVNAKCTHSNTEAFRIVDVIYESVRVLCVIISSEISTNEF